MDSSSSEDEMVLLLCAALAQKKKRKKRTVWVRDWIARRETAGAYHALMQELSTEDPHALKNFLRMDKTCFDALLTKVAPSIEKQTTIMRECIPAGEKLALTLRFLASGDSYASLEYLYRIPRNTICKFIPEVCDAIYQQLQKEYLQVPDTEEKWLKVQNDFHAKWQFPNCLGAIDGKHVAIKCPNKSGSEFFNYKKFFSILLLALVDADYKFIFVDVGANGRAGDAAVYANSALANALEHNTLNIPGPKPLEGHTTPVPSVVVGDDAFPLKPYLMKPFPLRNLSEEKRVFNYRLSRARRTSENCFAILASRFCIYRKPLQVSPDVAVKAILATIVLHNFLKSENDTIYHNNLENSVGHRNVTMQVGNRNGNHAMQVREEYAEYFMTNGQVPWQWAML